MRAWPRMTTIANAVMNNDTASSAVRPLYAGHISLLEKYGIRRVTPIVCEPDIQVYLHSRHFWTWIPSIRREGISLAVNLQDGHWA